MDVDLMTEIGQVRAAALGKHGEESIEHLPADDPRWLGILVEEVGEVAKALTAPAAAAGAYELDLRGELLDVLAVAWGWVDAVDGPPPAADPSDPYLFRQELHLVPDADPVVVEALMADTIARVRATALEQGCELPPLEQMAVSLNISMIAAPKEPAGA